MKIQTLRPWADSINKENYVSFIEELKKYADSDEIKLLICSYGGNTAHALSFYDIVTQSRLPLTTIGSGTVGSAATVIWLSGRRRLLTPHTTLFFHEVGIDFKDVCLDLTEIKARFRGVELDQRYIVEIISKRSGGKLSKNKVLRMLKEETNLTPREAIRLGFAHGITR